MTRCVPKAVSWNVVLAYEQEVNKKKEEKEDEEEKS